MCGAPRVLNTSTGRGRCPAKLPPSLLIRQPTSPPLPLSYPRLGCCKVDAHNVVPVWTTSDKQETMARTIRPKIHARPDFLGPIPELNPNAAATKLPAATDWARAQASLDLDMSVPGERGNGEAGCTGGGLPVFRERALNGYLEMFLVRPAPFRRNLFMRVSSPLLR